MGHFLLCFRFSLFIYFVAVAVVLGLEPTPSQMLDKHLTTGNIPFSLENFPCSDNSKSEHGPMYLAPSEH